MTITLKSSVHGEISVGSVLTWGKQYTDQEVLAFCQLSGIVADEPPEHLPYLLAIAPLTKLGGDLNYLSRGMDWTVTRPIRRIERVTAELEVTRLEPAGTMAKIAFNARLRCGSEVVITGSSKGLVILGAELEIV